MFNFNSVQEIDVAELSEWLDSSEQDFRVVDVREIREQMQGLVPGSVTMPLATLPVRLNEFSRDEKLVMVCRSGARSAQACMYLKQQGFDNVYNLRGGIMGWAGNNMPISQYNPA